MKEESNQYAALSETRLYACACFGCVRVQRASNFSLVSSSCGFKWLERVNWLINLRITCRMVGSGPGS